MKILVLNYRDRKHPAAGGAERHLHAIFSRLVQKGHQVVLLTTIFPGAPEREIVDGIQVVRHGGDLLFQWTVIKEFKKLDKEFEFDVIFEDLNKLPLFTPHLTKKPHLIQMHHLWKKSIFAEASFPVAFGVWLFERLIPLIYRKSPFVVVSPSTKKELASIGIAEERISLVYNGADGRDVLPIPEKGNYFLWLSRVHRYKGIWTALKAFRRFVEKNPGVRLKVAGGGPLLKKLPQVLKKWGISHLVDLEGFVVKEKKQELLQNAIALLQTSEKEGWGLTVIEAAECFTTTIASRVPGLMDSVKDGKTGILFENRDDCACASAMELLFKDTELRKKLELAAKKYSQEFSWDKAAFETEHLLEKIVNSPGSL